MTHVVVVASVALVAHGMAGHQVAVATAGIHGPIELAAGFGSAPPGATKVQTVVNWIKWIAATVAGVSLVVVGIGMIAQHHRPDKAVFGGRVATVIVGIMLASAASAIATALI